MTSLRTVLMAAATLALVGCGGDIVGPSGDGGADVPSTDTPPPTDRPPVDVALVCVTSADCPNGQECMVQQGCGTPTYCGPLLGRACTDDIAFYCGCDWETFTASSTCPTRSYWHRGRCEGADSGPPPPPPGCELPDGNICPVGTRCPAGDGCNTCQCDRFGALSCTEIACVDAGMPTDVPASRSCTSSGDCPPSMICQGAEGCSAIWTCVPAGPCTADLAPFCRCDGVTFRSSSSCPGQRYAHRGECP